MNLRYIKVTVAFFFLVGVGSCILLPLRAAQNESTSSQPSDGKTVQSEISSKQTPPVDFEAEQRTRTIALYGAVIEEMAVRAAHVFHKKRGAYPVKCLDFLSHYLSQVKEALHKNLLPEWVTKNFIALNNYTREILLRRGGLTRLNVRYLHDAYSQLIVELNKYILAREKAPQLDKSVFDEEQEALVALHAVLGGARVLLKEDLFPYGGFVGWYKYLWETDRVKACIGGTLGVTAAIGGLLLGANALHDKLKSNSDKAATLKNEYEPFEEKLKYAIKVLDGFRDEGKEDVPDDVYEAVKETLENLRKDQREKGLGREDLAQFKAYLQANPKVSYWLARAQARYECANVKETLHTLSEEIASVICPKNNKNSVGHNEEATRLPEIQHYDMLHSFFNEMHTSSHQLKTDYNRDDYRILVAWANAHPTITLAYVYRKKIKDAFGKLGTSGLFKFMGFDQLKQTARNELNKYTNKYTVDIILEDDELMGMFKKYEQLKGLLEAYWPSIYKQYSKYLGKGYDESRADEAFNKLEEQYSDTVKEIRRLSDEIKGLRVEMLGTVSSIFEKNRLEQENRFEQKKRLLEQKKRLEGLEENYLKAMGTIRVHDAIMLDIFKLFNVKKRFADDIEKRFAVVNSMLKYLNYALISEPEGGHKKELENDIKILSSILADLSVIYKDNEAAGTITTLQKSLSTLPTSLKFPNSFSVDQVTTTANILRELDDTLLLKAYIHEIQNSPYKKLYRLHGMKAITINPELDDARTKLEKLLKEEQASVLAEISKKEHERIALNRESDGGDELNRPDVDNLGEEIAELRLYNSEFLVDLIERLGYKNWENLPSEDDSIVIKKLKRQYKETVENLLKSVGATDGDTSHSHAESVARFSNDLAREVENLNLTNEQMLIDAQLIEGIYDFADGASSFDVRKLFENEEEGRKEESNKFFESLGQNFVSKRLEGTESLVEDTLVADTFLLYDILEALDRTKVDWTKKDDLVTEILAKVEEIQVKVDKKLDSRDEAGKVKSSKIIALLLNQLINQDKARWDEEHETPNSNLAEFIGSKKIVLEKTMKNWQIKVGARVSELTKWYVLNNLLDAHNVDWNDEEDITKKLLEKVPLLKAKGDLAKKFFRKHMSPFVWELNDSDNELLKECSGDVDAYLHEQLWELQQNVPVARAIAESILSKEEKEKLKKSSYVRVKAAQLVELRIIEKLGLDSLEDWEKTDPEALLNKLKNADKQSGKSDLSDNALTRSIIKHLVRLERKRSGACLKRKAALKKLTAFPADDELIIKEKLKVCTKDQLKDSGSMEDTKARLAQVKEKLANAKTFKWGKGEAAFQDPFHVGTLSSYKWPQFPKGTYKVVKNNPNPPITVQDLNKAYEELGLDANQPVP